MKTTPTDPVMQALAYPFERLGVDWPDRGSILLANPVPCPGPWVPDHGTAWQWWKGPADSFAGEGYKIAATDAPPNFFSIALVRLPRQRDEAQYVMAASYAALADGGIFVAAAANDAGGARLEKDLVPHLPDLQSASKYKCRIVWADKGKATFPASWLTAGLPRKDPGTGFWTQPGLFSWDRIDPATALLLQHIPAGLSGRVADLGCGTGVIADHVLQTSPGVTAMLCLDADARAVAACEKNIVERHPGRTADCEWADLSRPQKRAPVDTVIMNPPFHAEKMQAIALGQSFIANAAAMLKPGGTLLMVANAHLPYEDVLRKSFAAVEKKHEGGGFKIFHAKR